MLTVEWLAQIHTKMLWMYKIKLNLFLDIKSLKLKKILLNPKKELFIIIWFKIIDYLYVTHIFTKL